MGLLACGSCWKRWGYWDIDYICLYDYYLGANWRTEGAIAMPAPRAIVLLFPSSNTSLLPLAGDLIAQHIPVYMLKIIFVSNPA